MSAVSAAPRQRSARWVMDTTAPESPSAPPRPPSPALLLLHGPPPTGGPFPAGTEKRPPELGKASLRALSLATGSTMVLGRESAPNSIALTLPEDRWLSRQHARITVAKDAWPVTVQDLHSTHGTFVNGSPVRGVVTLTDGDLLRVGHSLLLLRRDAGLATATVSDAAAELRGESQAMRLVHAQLAQVALSLAPVLLLGESGTGKELAAQALHRMTRPPRRGPLVSINSATLRPERAAAELFGSRIGGFTGAQNTPGRIAAADQGTLFLDEIGELTHEVQAMLLRVLQDREVLPVGGNTPRVADVRFIAATNRDLAAAMSQGSFRVDLYHRLCGHTICLPALRERREDILLLLHAQWSEERALLTTPLAEALVLHRWPGNVRELYNVAAELRIQQRGAVPLELTPALAQRLGAAPTALAIPRPPRDDESAQLLALLQAGKSLSEMARALGVDRHTVRRRLAKHGLRRS